MKERELERSCFNLSERNITFLVCTSIIESGLDIPAANTILINHAEQFGLADLYQLRGGWEEEAIRPMPIFSSRRPRPLQRRDEEASAIQELSELGRVSDLPFRI